ncbi:MAG: fumarylacetoacetate hydrolase family protein [Acidobacteria bacterium]|nr:fumarylacetoacetate hydrolase family protein [Acidobacteriota bacterium]MCI0626165.1 fumarylacetoacetate hydrolase family protein [Acidobacteriota bacterium]MCI0718731.1 fumarylacetoacetate hydrolase family protein [Acidobacteriota bacterium]
MRLLAFVHRGRRSIGVELDAERVLDCSLAGGLPSSMRAFLELGDDGMAAAKRLLEKPVKGAVFQKRDLQVLGPVSAEERPKVICIGLNYADHAAESGSKVPDEPMMFAKYYSTLCGPGDNILAPPNHSKLDYEVELVIVVGKRAARVPQDEAYDYVAGYTCGHDVSERAFQRADGQWLRAKSSDTFAPIGPVIVTKDEITDPHALKLGTKVNGEVRQNSSTNQIIFRTPKLIEFISSYVTLDPGDMIFTGTPPGVGFGMNPPQYLKPGDVIEVWVEKIGSLTNTVVSA